jgi:hypothetical protein
MLGNTQFYHIAANFNCVLRMKSCVDTDNIKSYPLFFVESRGVSPWGGNYPDSLYK